MRQISGLWHDGTVIEFGFSFGSFFSFFTFERGLQFCSWRTPRLMAPQLLCNSMAALRVLFINLSELS